ncbi:MAG: glycerate kinase [Solirubrobacteraceae bacterium]|jgi:glycerate kinase
MAVKPSPVLVAPDSFRGTLGARTVADAIGRGLEATGLWQADLAPVADGGEGTAEVLLARRGGEWRVAEVSDPLGRLMEAGFALLDNGRTAVVEVAAASGLELVAAGERDAQAASSAGTGELMLACAAAGAVSILVGAGGSASTDGGAGAIGAIERGGGLGDASVTVLCDVRIPFELAAERFAPQKGADAAGVARLRARLNELAVALPRDPRGVAGTGAAGGLAGGLWAALGARLVGGAAFVLDALDIEQRLRGCHAVIVGEGRLDATTLDGKVAGEIATRARQMGVPAHAIVGTNALDRFEARILDLQTILEAGDVEAIERAARKLAGTL